MTKFRFDSFASEFASTEEPKTNLDQTADNDSGIGEIINNKKAVVAWR